MHQYQKVSLTRDVTAVQIPSGDSITLPIGTEVYITQTLGGTYTVATDSGLVRISKEDSDALDITEEKEAAAEELEEHATLEDKIWAALKTVYDPEIPVDIVNLGLVYDCIVTPQEDGSSDVTIMMTLTAPGCGMGPTIAAEAEARVGSLPGVGFVTVELVWEPAWNQDMVSEEGRMILGIA